MAEADRPIFASNGAEVNSTAPVDLESAPQHARKSVFGKRLLMLSVPVALALAGGYFWLTSGQTVSTDNAYVRQDIVSVSSDLNGRVIAVNVRENQMVRAGDVLFRIDPEPYSVAMAQADARIAEAQVSVQRLQTDYSSTSVDIAGAQEDLRFANEELARQQALMDRGFTTRARLEAAQHGAESARVALRTAQADAAKARAALSTGAQVPGISPAIAVAQAQRSKAALDLSRTTVTAPAAGRISQTQRLQVGQMMVTGLPAVSIVASDRSWIEANFKETDLDRMRPGQSATIRFDAYPELKIRGHVESIGAGTGSEFSVLPAQNANGNWVKVTQRVPVRIALDDKPARQMIAGLSAKVTVDLRDGKR